MTASSLLSSSTISIALIIDLSTDSVHYSITVRYTARYHPPTPIRSYTNPNTYLGVLDSAQCLHSTTVGELPPLPQLSTSSWSIPCDSCWRNHTEHWSGTTNTMHIQSSALLLCSGGPWLVVHYRGMAEPREQCLKSYDHIGRLGPTWLVAHVRSLPLTMVVSECTQPKERQSWESHD